MLMLQPVILQAAEETSGDAAYEESMQSDENSMDYNEEAPMDTESSDPYIEEAPADESGDSETPSGY